MPQWSQDPPTGPDHHAVRILRTPPVKPLVATVTSDLIQGLPTHFVHNRTVPCEGEAKCEWCQEGHSWRWHGYLGAILFGAYEHFLFEFTATAGETFKTYYRVHQTMRACKFQAHRPSGRPNGKVVIACRRLIETDIRLPETLNVRRILCHIWNVPYSNSTEFTGMRHLTKTIGVHPSKDDGRNRVRKP